MTEDRDLLLDEIGDRLAGFYSLRKTDSDQADEVLNSMGASDEVDRLIITELAAPRPLWLPDRFLEAHQLMIRALEGLDRNGTKRPPVGRLGPLKPVGRYLVQIVTMFIIRSHLRSLVDTMYRLYVRREANCAPRDPDRKLLRRAREDMERLKPGFKRNPLGIPTFLLGGAVLSGSVGLLQDATGVFNRDTSLIIKVVAVGILFGVAGIAGWAILRGAAVAHRRIQLTTDAPMEALYETIGRAGNAPNDQAGLFAIVSILLIVLALFLVPIGLTIAFS